ncbi:unnamed protein product [Coccothraustes coccothraustes]
MPPQPSALRASAARPLEPRPHDVTGQRAARGGRLRACPGGPVGGAGARKRGGGSGAATPRARRAVRAAGASVRLPSAFPESSCTLPSAFPESSRTPPSAFPPLTLPEPPSSPS